MGSSGKRLKSNGINKYGRAMHHQQQHRRLDGIVNSDRALKKGSSRTSAADAVAATSARLRPRRWHRRQRNNLGFDKILPEQKSSSDQTNNNNNDKKKSQSRNSDKMKRRHSIN